MRIEDTREAVALAVTACDEKKAGNITVLELDKNSSGFTDYFLICTGTNPRQIQTISDEIDRKLSAAGHEPKHVEGYTQAEWILLDYVDFVVHIFSENARKFYDLERLWKSATHVSREDLKAARASRKPARKTTAVKAAAKPAKKAASIKPRKTAARKSSSRGRKRS